MRHKIEVGRIKFIIIMAKYICVKCGKERRTVFGPPIPLKTCSGGTTTGLSHHQYIKERD
jgi:hypothetical protein